jgi:hypothetical protein
VRGIDPFDQYRQFGRREEIPGPGTKAIPPSACVDADWQFLERVAPDQTTTEAKFCRSGNACLDRRGACLGCVGLFGSSSHCRINIDVAADPNADPPNSSLHSLSELPNEPTSISVQAAEPKGLGRVPIPGPSCHRLHVRSDR